MLLNNKEKSSNKKNLKEGKKSNTDIDSYIFNSRIKLEKFMFEMIKLKIENLKKNSNLKIEYKNTKDPNVIAIEVKSNDEDLFKLANEQINIVQKYIEVNLPEKDEFFTLKEEQSPLSLANYISNFNIISYNVFKLGEDSVSIRIIGKEKSVSLVSALIYKYLESKDCIVNKKKEVEELLIKSKELF